MAVAARALVLLPLVYSLPSPTAAPDLEPYLKYYGRQIIKIPPADDDTTTTSSKVTDSTTSTTSTTCTLFENMLCTQVWTLTRLSCSDVVRI